MVVERFGECKSRIDILFLIKWHPTKPRSFFAQDEPGEIFCRRRHINLPAKAIFHEFWDAADMVEMRMSHHERVNILRLIREWAIDFCCSEVNALLNTAIDQKLPFVALN